MKRHPSFITTFLGCLSIYPLLVFILIFTGLSCYLASAYMPRLRDFTTGSDPVRVRHLRPLNTPETEGSAIPNAARPANALSQSNAQLTGQKYLPEDPPPYLVEPTLEYSDQAMLNPPAEAGLSAQVASNLSTESNSSSDSSPYSNENPIVVAALPTSTPTLDLVFDFPYSVDELRRRAKATPASDSILGEVVSTLMGAFDSSAETEAVTRRAKLATFTPTPTETSTATPTSTPTETSTPTQTPLPTDTPTPTITPTSTNTPPPTNTPVPPLPTPVPSPTETPFPTATPEPEYDFLLGEFFNSPTTNPFMVMYVAIVDMNEIPIGDMKVIGTRLDHNLTYESPLSTWYFEGYNAPGEVIKSGNVKFEPPGGIEATDWIIYLADANGARLSADVPFHTDPNDKQWYFIKFRRKF
ncbi:MAG: hypothetical protein H6631_12620 [Anaerolineaceae bacterium]|nr:hypothetical protein [Anaerolineaceae bacterium]